jgi:hypothetical protein
LIQSRPYNSSHRWSAVADLHTSPVITIDIQQKVSPEQGENGMDIQISCITVNDCSSELGLLQVRSETLQQRECNTRLMSCAKLFCEVWKIDWCKSYPTGTLCFQLRSLQNKKLKKRTIVSWREKTFQCGSMLTWSGGGSDQACQKRRL